MAACCSGNPGAVGALGRVIFPVPPDAVMALPLASAATTPLTVISITLTDGLAASWNVAVATTPSAKVAVLTPKTRQVFPEQFSVFPDALIDAPAATVTLVISFEKLRVHWSAAGCAPPDKVMGRSTVHPGFAQPDPRDSVTVFPKTIVGSRSTAAPTSLPIHF